MNILNWLLSHWKDIIVAVNAILAALIGIFMLIPGDSPERHLQKVVDFLERFSRK